MENFKKAQVVMLPTNRDSNLFIGNLSNQLHWNYSVEKSKSVNQNLYIILEDKIEEGDWFYSDVSGLRQKQYKKMQPTWYDKKIVATTDKSLTTDCKLNKNKFYYLPQPSQQFIEHYIENYNKREIIKNVLVEYIEELSDNGSFSIINNPVNIKSILKINPDNTINIKSVKESWNREEVIKFGNKVREYCKNGWQQDSLHKVFFEWDKYINENL